MRKILQFVLPTCVARNRTLLFELFEGCYWTLSLLQPVTFNRSFPVNYCIHRPAMAVDVVVVAYMPHPKNYKPAYRRRLHQHH